MAAVDRRRFRWALRSGGTGSNGTDQSGYPAEDDPLASGAREPVDMAQVRADDAFVEALGKVNRSPAADPLDERMASLLLSWRDDLEADSGRPLVDLDTAAAAVRNAPRPATRQVFGPLAAAAAVLVIAFTGIGLAARDAAPGTPLFGVTKVLYSDKAKSIEAAVAVRTKLDVAREALASGRVAEAQTALKEAQRELPVVEAEDGKGDLASRTDQLIVELSKVSPSTTPLPSLAVPAVPVPDTTDPTLPSAVTSATPTTGSEPPTTSTTPQPVPETPTPSVTPAASGGGETIPNEEAADGTAEAPDGTLDGAAPTT